MLAYIPQKRVNVEPYHLYLLIFICLYLTLKKELPNAVLLRLKIVKRRRLDNGQYYAYLHLEMQKIGLLHFLKSDHQ